VNTTTRAAGSSGRPPGEPADDVHGRVPPAARGATVIPDRVVARIAVRVAGTALRRLVGPRQPRTELAAPGARATTYAGTAQLALSVDLPYPADIAVTCRQLQREVAERVAQLTGLDVRDVTLTIRRLATVGGPDRVQ